MTMNDKKEVENLFWIEYKEELIEELNFRLALEWLSSGYFSTNSMLRVESMEFKGISYRKKKKLNTIWYFIKRLFKKKRKKE